MVMLIFPNTMETFPSIPEAIVVFIIRFSLCNFLFTHRFRRERPAAERSKNSNSNAMEAIPKALPASSMAVADLMMIEMTSNDLLVLFVTA